MLRTVAALGSVFVLAAGVACGESSRVAIDQSAIRNGKVEREFVEVGLLVFEGARAICTGTLIAPDVVLTAGHCVDEGKIPVAFYIGPGNAVERVSEGGATLGMTKYDVAAGVFMPGYVVSKKCPKDGLDVGLVKLRAPVAGVSPASFSGSVPLPGETCVGVGFGKHPLEDGGATRGQKRSAEMVFREERHGAFAFDDKTGGTEKGDSGGPLICAAVVLGVNSCGNRPDRFARLDIALPWIRAKIADWDAPWMGGDAGYFGPLTDAAVDDAGLDDEASD